MKFKPLAFASAVVLAVTSLTACSGKAETKKNTAEPDKSDMVTEYLIEDGTFQESFGNVPSADSGPQIFINDTTASPGEVAEVTVSVSNAERQWSSCGIHLTYPDVLECVLLDEEELTVDYKKGEALMGASGFVGMLWVNNLADSLTSRHLGSMFFCAICPDNRGLDGDMATFYFKVPEDAQPGAVYNIGFYYMSGDMFSNGIDSSFEKYAFEHVQGGTITIV